METPTLIPTEAVSRHVDELIESHHHTEFRSTTGTCAAVDELIERNEGLEQAVRALASELQRLTTRLDRTLGQPD